VNGFAFAAALVSSLIWPATVLLLALCWREPLTKLFNRIARQAKNVTGLGFSVELETQIAHLVSTGLALAPDGSVDREHKENVRYPVLLSADPVATIIDSYERVRYCAIDKLTKLHGQSSLGSNTNILTLADTMHWYGQTQGHVDETLGKVTAELESIYNTVVQIDQPLNAFSPKERVYATHYQAVADRVIEHFKML
jgi:hypothetical protein